MATNPPRTPATSLPLNDAQIVPQQCPPAASASASPWSPGAKESIAGFKTKGVSRYRGVSEACCPPAWLKLSPPAYQGLPMSPPRSRRRQ